MGGVRWASDQADARLAPLGLRWHHVQGVVRQARMIGAALSTSEAQCLIAAAYLHDIGWAPELADTGFHPLDGGRWLRGQRFERLSCLVAHHSASRFEAHLRGVGHLLSAFDLEESATSDALTYCDVTTGPTGELVTPEERWAEIIDRYGEDNVVAVALRQARPSLEVAVARTQARLLTIEA
ncbi:MAG: HD domain-containing protein [Acidimicrobiaceae bacterium]|nr:HD domain-containing protein [Acidimicrobiaceae bacterium]